MSVIIALLLLNVLVFVHELGHLFVGLAMGAKAESFSIGFGPIILKKNIKGISFRISAIPFGGYCQFSGESPEGSSGATKNKDNFLSVAPLKRVLIYLAGPLCNYGFALILLIILASMPFTKTLYEPIIGVFTDGRYIYSEAGTTIAYEYGLKSGDRITSVNNNKIDSDIDFYNYLQNIAAIGKTENVDFNIVRDGVNTSITIPSTDLLKGLGGERPLGIYFGQGLIIKNVVADSAAKEAGLEIGDEILAINDTTVSSIADFRPIIMDNPSMKINITVLRNGETITREAIPKIQTVGEYNYGSLGVEFMNIPMSTETVAGTPFPASIKKGFDDSVSYIKSYVSGLGLLFTGKLSLRENLGGPIRIIQITSQVVETTSEHKLTAILSFTATISLILFFMNLLPLPVVDGGMIIICIIEFIRGKPINEKVLSKIQMAGAFFLITLAIFVTLNDITQLF